MNGMQDESDKVLSSNTYWKQLGHSTKGWFHSPVYNTEDTGSFSSQRRR